jgi:hypothetical protein
LAAVCAPVAVNAVQNAPRLTNAHFELETALRLLISAVLVGNSGDVTADPPEIEQLLATLKQKQQIGSFPSFLRMSKAVCVVS